MSIIADPDKIKALVFDLDGTLLATGSVLTERTIRAIESCKRRGIKIVLATGRAMEAVEPFRKELGLAGPMIYFNGSVVADMEGGRILKTTLLDTEAAKFCLLLAREMGVYFQLYLPGSDEDPRLNLMADRDGPEREFYHQHTGMLAGLIDLKTLLERPKLEGVVKCMYLAEPEVQERIRPRLDEHFGKSVYVVQTYRTFLEVLSDKASKGHGLAYVLESLLIKPEEVIAFGDEENDIPMLERAGYSAAPANAKESVKAVADQIIGSNDAEGVAEFLEEFFAL